MSKVFNMVGGGGVTASIFVTGLSETDTVTATNGSKTKTGVWTQIPNPAIIVPDGYTQLEYIKSTGTQWIDTGIIVRSGYGFKGTWRIYGTINDTKWILGTYRWTENVGFSNMIAIGWYEGGSYFQWGSDVTSRNAGIVIGQKMTATLTNLNYSTSTGINLSLPNYAFAGDVPMALFGRSAKVGSASNLCTADLFEFETYNGNDTVQHLIPCRRDSDGVVGMFDLVTNEFFGNSGTGTFTAGPEIPKTIDSFLIDKIKDFGTWTVTATDGTKTATQDVLVDVITEYGIEMSLSA